MMGLLDLLLGVFKCNHMYYIKDFFSIHFPVQVCFLVVLCFPITDNWKWPQGRHDELKKSSYVKQKCKHLQVLLLFFVFYDSKLDILECWSDNTTFTADIIDRKWIGNYFHFKKMPKIHWSTDSNVNICWSSMILKGNIFVFWAVGQTKQAQRICQLGLWEIVMDIFWTKS